MTSLEIATGQSLRREETWPIALLLAFAGGYLDAYAWIIHGVMANAQTANLVLLWVYGSLGQWQEALHFVPPILAFAGGVVTASWLRRAAGERASVISLVIEILLLVVVGILHNRLPELAGTLGISFVAAMQAAVFTRIEGTTYSSVMITGTMRQAIESLFAALGGDPAAARRSSIFATLCAMFGLGAAVGAFATKAIPNLALILPVIALLFVSLRCNAQRGETLR
jgi:uncharacterized membrane protein YoaK (UPF0700 family)